MSLKIQIITQEKLVYECDSAEEISIPTTTGQITILPRHIPLITLLDVGEIHLDNCGANEFFAVTGGIVQVADNTVTILARTAENAAEIDTHRAEEARDRARAIMESGVPVDADQYRAIEASLRRAMIRLKVASHRPRRGTGPGEMSFGGQ